MCVCVCVRRVRLLGVANLGGDDAGLSLKGQFRPPKTSDREVGDLQRGVCVCVCVCVRRVRLNASPFAFIVPQSARR